MRSRDEGFAEWYRGVHTRLVNSVAVATGDVDLAAEATDEALARALERWPRVRSMDSPEGWVFTVAMNEARRRLRRRTKERELLRRGAAGSSGTLEGPAGELWELVADLPARQREAVVLRHVGHLTEQEVATAMGVSRGTVSTNLRRAHAVLRAVLDGGAVGRTVGTSEPDRPSGARHG